MKYKPGVPTCMEIECVVAGMWGYRQNIIVPNISWGAGLHECDLLILSKSGWASEIEIKVSRSDLKKDSEKGHGHESDKIRYLYFAIPEKLRDCLEFIPARAGIVIIKTWAQGFKGELIRGPETNKSARKWTETERANLGRLGCMRIWSLKTSLINEIKNKQTQLL